MEKTSLDSISAHQNSMSESAEMPLSSGRSYFVTLRPIMNYLSVPEVKNLGNTGSIIENHYKTAKQRVSIAFLLFVFVVSLLVSLFLFPIYLFDRIFPAFYRKALIIYIHDKDGKK